MSDSPSWTIHHDEARGRFHTEVEGHACVADYRREGQTVWMTHTRVPRALEGRGIAAALVRAALEWFDREGLKVVPVCSYVQTYMRRHPETRHLLAEGES